MKAPAIDGWSLLTVRDSEGFPGKTLRYARLGLDDVALIFVPEGAIDKKYVSTGLQGLLDRGPPK